MSHIFHYFKNLPKISVKTYNPLNSCIPLNIYQPPNALPTEPPPTAFAATGPSINPSTPGVAAPTKGVVSC